MVYFSNVDIYLGMALSMVDWSTPESLKVVPFPSVGGVTRPRLHVEVEAHHLQLLLLQRGIRKIGGLKGFTEEKHGYDV